MSATAIQTKFVMAALPVPSQRSRESMVESQRHAQQEPLVTYLRRVRIAAWSADPSDVAAGRLVTPSPRLLILHS